MKIGILTHQYINNYGAFLQAWALREAIAELFPNDEVQIIDYVNLKHFIINAGGWFRFYKNRESFKDWMEKIKLPRTFAKARNQEMILSKRCFNAKQINALDFDCIIVYKNKNGERQEKVITGNLLSYVNLFSRSFTYRKNCYSCPFASEKRVGDLTLGDFWGFHEEYPSYDEKQGLSNGKGVSCILVNTNQGKVALEQCESQFVLMTSDFEKVARHNDQLHSPSKYSPKREQILELYQKEGYEAVDRYFHKNYKKDILKYTVSGMLPKGLKRNIKKMAGKIKNK